jgi:anion-transporting  ArsA/GET3 family ATPase
MVMSVLERLTGAELIGDISEFLQSFDGMYQGFADRASSVKDLLASDGTTFVVVTGPRPEPSAEAAALWQRLQTDGYPLGALVVNRVHPMPAGGDTPPSNLAALLRDAGAADAEGLAMRATDALAVARARASADRHEVDALVASLGAPQLITVPALESDPVEGAGIANITRALGTP